MTELEQQAALADAGLAHHRDELPLSLTRLGERGIEHSQFDLPTSIGSEAALGGGFKSRGDSRLSAYAVGSDTARFALQLHWRQWFGLEVVRNDALDFFGDEHHVGFGV